MTDPAINVQYQIVERAEAGDRYLHHFDTRADAEKARGIYEQWARAQRLRNHYEILERQELMGAPFVADPELPKDVIICLPEIASHAPKDYWLNYRAFEADAKCAVMMQMIELAGFPAYSEAFAELERQALEIMRRRELENYLAFLQSKAHFERIEKIIQGDGAEPTATGAKENRGSGQ